MTIHERFINPRARDNFWPRAVSLPAQEPSREDTKPTKAGMSLQTRLLLTVLPTMLLPLGIANLLGFKVVQNLAKQELVKAIENTVIISQQRTQELLQEPEVQEEDVRSLNQKLVNSVGRMMYPQEKLQILSPFSGKVVSTIWFQSSQTGGELQGGQTILEVAQLVSQASKEKLPTPETLKQLLQQKKQIRNIQVVEVDRGQKNWVVNLEKDGQFFTMQAVPQTGLVAVASVDSSTINEAGQNLLKTLMLMAAIIGTGAVGILLLLARHLAQPLIELAQKAEQVSSGDLSVRAELKGTQETLTLGNSFNNLLERVNQLLRQQESLTLEKTNQKEALEQEILQLLTGVEGILEKDLTVRANVTDGEMSTVADLVNAIIDSLKDIVIQVKESANEVSTALVRNEQSIEYLADEAIKEVQETRKTLNSVEEMSESIRDVSGNASKAAFIADDSYHLTEEGTKVLDKTVQSILNLRSTVGETTKKMKRLGESSQKISQVVSLIEETALKTNLLAINASVEASRAGEQGQGFTVVAEQVGALAEQSALATQEIAQIVATIQAETQEVTEAMELGTSMVVDSTRLVEATRKRISSVVQKSRTIKELMQHICDATVSQVDTSLSITDLMLQITRQSEQRLAFSREVAQSIQTTAEIARELETAVGQYKVNEA